MKHNPISKTNNPLSTATEGGFSILPSLVICSEHIASEKLARVLGAI